MEAFFGSLLNLVGNANGARNGAVILLAVAIFFVGMVLLMLLARFFDPVKGRLERLVVQDTGQVSAMQRTAEKLDRLSHFFLPSNQELQKSTADRLVHAGYRSRNSLVIYYFIRSLAIIVLPALVLLAYPLFPQVEPQKLFWYAAMAGVVGMIVPSYYLDKKIARQQRLIRNGLPDAIDLLVVCTEAGLGLNAAILRVAQVIVEIHPALAEELLLVTAEMRAGVDRTQAMANLARRTGVEDIKGLVTVLAQSMRFGTSISQTLRIYAEEFRDKRMQKADEEAAKLATKMIFPLVICILPSFFIIAVGPAVIKAIAVFSTMGK
ncbi:MAG: type II secretion system F family protein [Methylococcaceae bacterium]|nr:type II secretion system F family protein [Methylococcaceae bacterium]